VSGTLQLLSGGAANGLVKRLQAPFLERMGMAIAGTFSAVGQMREALLTGQPCDVVILTEALVRELIQTGHLQADSARRVGAVQTGLGVPEGHAAPAMRTPEELSQALQQADGIYMADPHKATAGIHFMKVVRELGLEQVLGDRLLGFANGQTAMAAMAERAQQAATRPARLIGCTQVTEILNTPGIALVGLLPPRLRLATAYTAAITRSCAHPQAAAQMIELLTEPGRAQLRKDCGFE